MYIDPLLNVHHPLLDHLTDLAYDDLQPILGTTFWNRANGGDRRRALRNLIANLLVCVQRDDHDEVGVSRTRGDFAKIRLEHYTYAAYVRIMDGLARTGWCILRPGFHARRPGLRSYRARLLPTFKLARYGGLPLGVSNSRPGPVWIVRDDQKNVLRAEPIAEERREYAELRAFNSFMALHNVEIAADALQPDVVVEIGTGRIRNRAHVEPAALGRYVALQEVHEAEARIVLPWLKEHVFVNLDDVAHETVSRDATSNPIAWGPFPTTDATATDGKTADRDGDVDPTTPPSMDHRAGGTWCHGTWCADDRPEHDSAAWSGGWSFDHRPPHARGRGHYSDVFFENTLTPVLVVEKTFAELSRFPPRMVRLDTTTRRVFSRGRGDLGGRFYTPVQNLPPRLRAQLRFDGEHVVELDYRGLHLTMCYHLAGLDAPQDPYKIYGDGRDAVARPLVKKLMVVAINAEPGVNIASIVRNEFRERGTKHLARLRDVERQVGQKLGAIAAAMTAAHPAIASFFASDAGVRLQRIDAEIMRRIIRACVERNIPLVPVHDSIVVPRRHRDVAREIMARAYRSVMGRDIVLEEK